jgi:hypothetical protein
MPRFDTPAPISVTVELGVGNLRVLAADRSDTTVEVRPSDAAKKSDVAAAEQTQVDFDGGRLLIRAPKGWRQWTPRGGSESIDVEVALPADSDVHVKAGIAELRCAGRLGACDLKTGVGEIRVEQAGSVQIKTGAGDITVEHAVGHADLVTGSGSVQISSIDGTAEIKNSNGSTWIGEVTGELKVKAANGKIAVDHADAGIAAKTANGDIRLGDVASGTVLAETGHGKLDIAIRQGVAAWLDFNTGFGRVHNGLEQADRPQPGESTVEIRARSAFGDITVGHSPVTEAGASR